MKLYGILSYTMGSFLCLRGSASIKDLAKISEPNPDVQRELIEEHKGEMATFLNNGRYIFFPEVILSTVISDADTDKLESFREMVNGIRGYNQKIGDFNISVKVNEYSNKENKTTKERIKIAKVQFDKEKVKFNRIDGNHRLSAAEDVKDSINIPFCILLFDSETQNDEFSRAIFHNINSKQIPLKIEENRKVIIESKEVFSDYTLETDPSFGMEYKYTRLLLNDLDITYFKYINSYIGHSKYTFFIDIFKYLMNKGIIPRDDTASEKNTAVDTIKTELHNIEQALRESDIIVNTDNISVLGALAYYKLTNENKYKHFIKWVKKNNIGDIKTICIDEVIRIYDNIYENVPKKAFLARWYPAETDKEYKSAQNRLDAIKELVESFDLKLIDLGTQDTGSFDINSAIYENIRNCDIFIADLTGIRHNVMIEVGYALDIKKGRILFYTQGSVDEIPFDIKPFRVIAINESCEIRTKVKLNLESILESFKT